MKKPATDFLLIDISNSFTKLAFASRSRIGRPSTIATPILTAERIARILHAHDAATVVASSVVPKKNREIKRAAGNRKVIWLTSQSRLNVRIDYPNPKTIGADRLANAVAVAKLYGTPAIVIDFGTAVTFDIVAPDNAYIGGVIAPGLEAMTNFLYDRTALLPRISLREPRSAIGKSTNQAMVAGAIFGYRGLVPIQWSRWFSEERMAEQQASRHHALYQLLGDLPDRARPVAARTVSRETRDTYFLEKLVLDLNGIEPVPA